MTIRRPGMRPFLLALVVILLATACGSGSTGSPSPSGSEPAAAASEGLPPLTTEAAIDVLSAAGIAVHESLTAAAPVVAPSEPVSPLRLLREQVDGYASEATSGGGVSGDEIDEWLPTPPDTVAISALLAGYVATARTPGARFLAERMEDQDLADPSTVLFPSLVIPLFAGEVLAAIDVLDGGGTLGATTNGPLASPNAIAALPGTDLGGPAARPAAGDPCGDFSRFFQNVLKSIPEKILEYIPKIPFLHAAIEWALTKGIGMAVDLLKELTGLGPVLEAVQRGVQALATGAMVLKLFRPWKVSVTLTPDPAHVAVGASVSTVDVSAVIDDGGDPFSPAIKSCAMTLLGVKELPKIGAPGSKVEWIYPQGADKIAPGAVGSSTVGEDRRLHLTLQLTSEPTEYHLRGRLATRRLEVRAVVQRQDVGQIKTMVERLITSVIPSSIYQGITGFFGDPLGGLTKLTDVSGRAYGVISYHVRPDPEPDPPAGEEPPAAGPGVGGGTGGTGGADSEFCRRWKALLQWEVENRRDELTQKWSIHIAEQLDGMRQVAPPSMVDWVDTLSLPYFIYGAVATPYNVPNAGLSATQIPAAMRAINRYCGVQMEGLS